MTTAEWSVLHVLDKHGDAWKDEIVQRVTEAGCGDISTKNPFDNLLEYGLITRPQHGRYSLTDEGREALHRLFWRVFPLVIRFSLDLMGGLHDE